jgi:hypothetical protein
MIDRHYTKKRSRNQPRSRRPLWLIAVLLLLCGAFLFKSPLSLQYDKFAAWVASHRHSLVATKQTVASKRPSKAAVSQPESQIHFEFYTALPNMRLEARAPKALSTKDLEQALADAVKEAKKNDL